MQGAREPGFYWVRLKNEEDWRVGEYVSGVWSANGTGLGAVAHLALARAISPSMIENHVCAATAVRLSV